MRITICLSFIVVMLYLSCCKSIIDIIVICMVLLFIKFCSDYQSTGRAGLELQNRKAQELWLACETLKRTIATGKLWDQNYINFV